MPAKKRDLIAYEIYPDNGMPIAPAPIERDWMDSSRDRFAYRCLPLVVANQAGWVIECPATFTVRWNGGPRLKDLRIRFVGQRPDSRVLSHFGHGVLTFSLPYLFRTPRGINLWVKGVSNWIKDGIQPLEGIVESDWSAATFTMNWKLTRPNYTVRFERGEPSCMIVPIPRGLAEKLEPKRVRLSANKKLHEQHSLWQRERGQFIQSLVEGQSDALRRGWQKDYFLGFHLDGRQFKEHQTRLRLMEFG